MFREIQKDLKAKGLSLASEADESTTGPASLMLIDPDGNPVLIDQHVDSPPNSKSKTVGKTYTTTTFLGIADPQNQMS